MKHRESGLPFDDFRAVLNQLPGPDEDALKLTRHQVSERLGERAGTIGELCEWYAQWSGRSPAVSRPVLTLFAGTHAVDRSTENALLQDVTEISSGASSVNRICHQHDIGLKLLDLALQIPVADISAEAALDEKSCVGTIAFGMEAIAGGTDLLCAAALENGPNISIAAILSTLWNLDPRDVIGAGACELAQKAADIARPHAGDALETLRRLGGRETAAICGAILAARSQHIPVILAGPTAVTCAATLVKLESSACSHCILAQITGVNAIDRLAEEIGLKMIFSEFHAPDPGVQTGIAAGLMKSAGLALSPQG